MVLKIAALESAGKVDNWIMGRADLWLSFLSGICGQFLVDFGNMWVQLVRGWLWSWWCWWWWWGLWWYWKHLVRKLGYVNVNVKALTHLQPSIGQSFHKLRVFIQRKAFAWKTLLLQKHYVVKRGCLEQALMQTRKCRQAVTWTHSDGLISIIVKTPASNDRYRSISSCQPDICSLAHMDICMNWPLLFI